MKSDKLSFTEIEVDANATAARICIAIWGPKYDSKITPEMFDIIKELIRDKLE